MEYYYKFQKITRSIMLTYRIHTLVSKLSILHSTSIIDLFQETMHHINLPDYDHACYTIYKTINKGYKLHHSTLHYHYYLSENRVRFNHLLLSNILVRPCNHLVLSNNNILSFSNFIVNIK